MAAPSGSPVQARDPLVPRDAKDAHPALQEPSMEDILASIRRIIAADQTVGSGRELGPLPRRASPSTTATQQRPVTPEVAAASPEVGSPGVEIPAHTATPAPSAESAMHPGPFPMLSGLLDDLAAGSDAEPAAAPTAPADPRQPQREPETQIVRAPVSDADDVYDLDALDAESVGIAADPLISSTAGASISSSFQALAQSVLIQDPEVIERIARDALRPMLKAWLDDNLPSMVERLVRGEIERVARGGRG